MSLKATSPMRESLPSLRRLLRRFAPYVRRQRWLVGVSTLLLLADVAFRLLEPWPLKYVLDQVVRDKPGQGRLAGLDDGTLLAVCALAVIGVAVLRAGASYLSTVGLALAGNRVLTEVRAQLYRHVQRLSLGYHARARTGDLVTRLTGDVGRLQDVAVTAALPLVANTLTVVAMAGVMLWLNPLLAVVSLAAFPLMSPTFMSRGRSIRGVARRHRKREGAMASTATEALGAIKLVQALSLERILERRFASQNSASLREGVRAKKLAAGLERKVDVLVAVGSALVLYVGAQQVQRGALTAGELVVFMLYLKTAFKPMRDVAKYTGRIAQAAAAGERIVDLLDTEPEIRDEPGAVAAPPFRGEVAFDDVTFAYEPGGRPALDGVSLVAEPGQVVALVGPSGAGKSSAAGLLLRLYDPQRGAVMIDGRDLRSYTLASVRMQIAVVLQESVLFGVTVRENIAYGAPRATHDDVVAAAGLANAHEFITALPDGYDTVLGERGATLSGGQRQRIAIARAAIRQAPIVVLDEPTTGLDQENAQAVSEALANLAAGRTTFVVAHDLRTIEHADQILYLDDGKVVERGTHAELLAYGGRYATVHRLQSAARATGTLEAVDAGVAA